MPLKKKYIYTIGIHNYGWLATYRRFRDNYYHHSPHLIALVARRMRWHAKTFVLLSNGEPCFAIIGSSNMTSSAFGSPRLVPNYNYESDVIIWDSKRLDVDRYFIEKFDEYSNEASINHPISLIYRPEDNMNITEKDRLNNVLDMLVEAAGNFRILD